MTGQPPVIVSQPQSVTNLSGTTASFSVVANGSAPLSYRWQFNGTNLLGNVSATNATLALANVQTNQSGNYAVIISNQFASVTSSVATLAVFPRLQFVGSGSSGLSWSNGMVCLQLTGGLASSPVVLQVSKNLQTWLPILTNAPGAPLQFTDPAGSQPRRFYRAQQ